MNQKSIVSLAGDPEILPPEPGPSLPAAHAGSFAYFRASGETVILKTQYSQYVGEYEVRNGAVTLTDRNGRSSTYGFEFVFGGELI